MNALSLLLTLFFCFPFGNTRLRFSGIVGGVVAKSTVHGLDGSWEAYRLRSLNLVGFVIVSNIEAAR